jgi:aryl-alcohol dehydrogenase-like predicted oxidoreductase
MQIRKLGKTQLDVSVLSIGGLYTSSLAGGAEETRRILNRAIELGINAIDTAPAYADSELTIGKAIAGLNAPLIITTKLGGRPQPFQPQSKDALRQSVHESLKLLGRDTIDTLMIHEPDRPQQYGWWSSYDPLDGPVIELMDELKQAGTIRFTGLAGTTVTEMTSLVRSGIFDVLLTAFNYNPLIREANEELIPAATEQKMGIVLASVLGQGFLARRFDSELTRPSTWLSTKRRDQFKAYYKLLDETGMSPIEMGLRFAISNSFVSTVPIGCKTMEQLELSVQAINKGPLPIDVLAQLDQIASICPMRSFEEPMILPFGKNYHGPGIANMGAAVQVGKLEQ